MLINWPPGTSPVRTSVFLPRRAAVTPALRPAMPPPAITTSHSVANVRTPNRRRQRPVARDKTAMSRIRSTPSVDRDGRDVIGAEYFPRALGLAADHDHVDVARLVHLHDLVGRSFELCSIRLVARRGGRPAPAPPPSGG